MEDVQYTLQTLASYLGSIRELGKKRREKSKFCDSFQHFLERPVLLDVGGLSPAFPASLALSELQSIGTMLDPRMEFIRESCAF